MRVPLYYSQSQLKFYFSFRLTIWLRWVFHIELKIIWLLWQNSCFEIQYQFFFIWKYQYFLTVSIQYRYVQKCVFVLLVNMTHVSVFSLIHKDLRALLFVFYTLFIYVQRYLYIWYVDFDMPTTSTSVLNTGKTKFAEYWDSMLIDGSLERHWWEEHYFTILDLFK